MIQKAPPITHAEKNEWYHPSFDYLLITLANTLVERENISCFITNDAQQAAEVTRLLTHMIGDKLPILHLPNWETLPYDHFSPHRDILSERMTSLSKLMQLDRGLIITDSRTAATRLPPKAYLAQQVFQASLNDHINPTSFRENMAKAGYRHVNQVYEHGDFCVRGDIIDIFPMGSQQPIRLSLFDNSIDAIKVFDPNTQLSERSIDSIVCLPAEEYPLNDAGIAQFRQAWRQLFSGNPKDCPMYQSISDGRPAPGAEYYLPLFFEKTETLFDYLPDNTLLISTPEHMKQLEQFWALIERRHEQYNHDAHKPICEPSKCFIPMAEWRTLQKMHQQLILCKEKKSSYGISFPALPLPPLGKQTPRSHPFDRLKDWLSKQEKTPRLIFCAETNGRREVIKDHCISSSWIPSFSISLEEAYQKDHPVQIIITPLIHGFQAEDGTLVITESDLLGHITVSSPKKRKKDSPFMDGELVRDLSDLNHHDILCHKDHGLCLYEGLEVIKTGDCEQEYMTLRFDNDDTLYLPITALDRIGRYIGRKTEDINLSALGSKQWDKKKAAAKKKVEDLASSLLNIYAKRELAKRPPASAVNDHFKAFKAEFPFHETDDQTATIDAILSDMASDKSMDRLVCGDVGFGKTEVAMQAAFHAIQQNRQVVFLAPTTLLASQHHATCVNRFANWPIRIELLTRGVTGKELNSLIDGLADGSVDLVVATHKILNPDIRFKRLGLLIIDEEHRFGVAHKEKIKALKASVDMLAMTATPIPRTLNLSLSKLRDLSIISTPPARRLAIKTFVEPYSMPLIEEAILREYNRGGQVFFLHNDIATMPKITEAIEKAMPNIKTRIAHGQMTKNQLERIMADFQHQQFHVLVATTIIESGIDIPNANTIIVNDADKFGLAQLHQCRGRVGRSHHQAYAYLLFDRHKQLTKESQLRLKALTEHTDLGAGFQLAMQDLEIRGAGELLGKEQSGQMEGVGYGLYLEMLEEAIAMQRNDDSTPSKPSSSVDIDLGVSALLPKHYIHDIPTRLSLYKKLSGLKEADDIDEFKAKLVDRFGPLPEETEMLLESQRLQQTASIMGIKRLRVSKVSASIHFAPEPNIQVPILFKLIQDQRTGCKLINKTQLSIRFDPEWDVHARIKKTKSILAALR